MKRIDPHATARARQQQQEMTIAEVRLWNHLRRNQLGVRFRRQVPIGPYIVDFACLHHRLVIEVDGASHDSEDTWFHDRRRDSLLGRLGWRVVRFTDEDIDEDPASVVEQICSELEELGAPPARGSWRPEGA